MDVAGWLRKLGLERYEPAFRENKIDSTILAKLTAEDLKDLGVSLVGERRRLLDAIALLRSDASSDGSAGLGAAMRGDGGAPSRSDAERRQLTVMFCDLVGSTALSARLDPEDMREIIGAYHRCCAHQIKKAGGFVAKYMGDGVLGYFGYPQADEDDAERAVRAALALREAVPKLRTEGDATLQVRVGLATGLVVVGDLIGEGDAQERGVVGDTPNLAARLQSMAEPGEVVISNSTRRLTGGIFEYRELGRVTLKGLTDPVQAWQVTGTSAIQSRFEAQHGAALTPLVGREEELELLLRRWERAKSGKGQVVLLSGEPGIGKSRLTVALQERLEEEPQTRLRYFCSPHHTDSAFSPVISQLERAAAFERQDAPETKLDKLVSLLALPSSEDSDIQLVAELLSIPTGDRYAPLNVSPQLKKEKTFEALLRQFEMLSRQRPVLLLYEDVHWIDPSSRELLDMTVERVANLPVLLIITFRTEFQPSWTDQAHVSTLGLSRLGRREGTALVQRVAGNNSLPDDIMAEIVERTDGVPLFVEELTKAVLEAGPHDEDTAGSVSIVPLPALAVPPTLHASLMARLDRLGPVAKEVAQIGAAIGREFSYELLSPVAERSDGELRGALNRLADAGLVFQRGMPPEATFLFKHALVRDAAYSTLLRSRRQQLHGRIAATLESQFPDIAAAHPEVLARHCTEASLHEKAIGYWSRAGDQAVQRASNREAIEHLRRALSLNEKRPETMERSRRELAILSQLGPALMSVYGWPAPEVGTAFDRAREVARKLESSVDLAPPLVGLWLFHIARGQVVQAEEISHELFKIARDGNDDDILLQAHHTAWPTGWVRGKLADAIAHIDAGMDLYDEVRHARHRFVYMGHDPAVCALSVGATVHWVFGQPGRGMRLESEARKLAQRLQHPPSLALGLWYVGEAQVARRDVVAAMATAQELLAVCDEHRLPLPRATALMFFGWALAHGGDVAEGIHHLEEGLGIWDRLGARVFLARAICLLAEAYLQGGRYADGVKQVDLALATAVEIGDEGYIPKMHIVRASLLAHLGRSNLEAAETNLQRGIAVSRTQGARGWELRASTSLARLWCDQGKRTEAQELLTPIYGWFTEGFDMPDLKEAKALLDELAS
jgi:class 3 adenylate cyclase/predicted ATPase